MADDEKHKIPLDLCRQAALKLDGFIADVYEIREYENLVSEDRQILGQIAETAGEMLAAIIAMASKEMEEEEFLSNDMSMNEIDGY